MTESGAALVSVRGEARTTVPPDSGELSGAIEVVADTRAAALGAAAAALAGLTGDLAALGGVPLDAQAGRAALTWSARSAATGPEYTDKLSGERAPTGRVRTAVAVLVAVRDIGLMDSVGGRLAASDPFRLHQVTWQVDWDNPAWARVRADAIRAAVSKARDYAATLGGTLARIEHIADPGLLSAAEGTRWMSSGGYAARAARVPEGDWPDLDPVPQELTVQIEARFTALGMTAEPAA
jgi:uncharacterized protein